MYLSQGQARGSSSTWHRRSQETQEEVTVLGEVLVRRPAVLVSSALVLLGVLDCLVSLACAAVSAREACGLYSKGEDTTQGLSEGHNRKERLYRWLGQQKTIFPIGSSQGPPRGVSSVSQFVPLSSDSSSSSATPRKSSSGPSGASSSLPSASSHRVLPSSGSSSGKTNSTRVTPPSVPSILKPSSLPSLHGSRSLPPSSAAVGLPQHFPAHAAHPSLYYPHLLTPMMPYYPTDQVSGMGAHNLAEDFFFPI
ncbi:hypothetical protein C7M84_005082 [Penaeus vannamei]|uniref:Uncharacterized protein n=1 Tax=Penaeus vannamei TaxID=6689 RepID=A0A3R7M935_PENVA|nr:hypothetical protein C7M84_005082 [Penaeus vannamei]